MKRILAAVLSLSLLLSFGSPAMAQTGSGSEYFTDIPAGAWYAEYIDICYESGLMKGIGNGRFDPDGVLTCAEMIMACARLHDVLRGGDGNIPLLPEEERGPRFTGKWYDDAMWYWENALEDMDLSEDLIDFEAHVMNTFTEIDTSSYAGTEAECPRAYLALMLALVLEGENLPAINEIGGVSDLDFESVRMLYCAGILSGSDEYGTFNPESTLKRSELAAVIARVVVPELRLHLDLKTSEPTEPADTIVVYNWGEYIAPHVISEFEYNSGLNVDYRIYSTPEALYAMLKSGVQADVIITQDYMLDRLRREGMLAKISNPAGLPGNRDRLPGLETLAFDPTGEYTVPYMWGVMGLVYDNTKVKSADRLDALFATQTAGILMHDSIRENMALALKHLGYSVNTTDTDELDEAFRLLLNQKKQVKQYGDYGWVMDALEHGEAAVAPLYNGDAYFLCEANAYLYFDLPAEGSIMFVDAVAIAASTQNREGAELFLRYLCDTDVAKKNVGYIGYATPFRAVHEKLSQHISQVPQLYPSAEYLKNCEVLLDLPEDIRVLYDAYNMELKAGS